ncbi:MAG: hypothetical protein L6Q66_11920 [Bacteroidia bacterium]|nr:hypothetical protein [Bacteroidia bacterium]
MEKGSHKQKNGRNLRKTSINGYQALLKNMMDYEEYKQQTLRIKDYDALKSVRAKQAEGKYWRKFYFEFTEYLYNHKNVYDNYAGAQMKLLKAFFNYLNKEQIVSTGSYTYWFYCTSQEIPVVTLSPEQLNFLIYNKEFEQSLPKNLQVIKDMFVFGCCTALRFSDLIAAQKRNLEQINEHLYLVVNSIKTGIPSRILLPDCIKDILQKYKRRKKSIFPPISKSNFNISLKKICYLAGWTQEVMKQRNKRGIAEELFPDNDPTKRYRFCDLVSSHLMRRTAITTMLRLGMHETNVRLISGHRPNSKSFYRYVYIADSYMAEVMQEMYKKLESIGY